MGAMGGVFYMFYKGRKTFIFATSSPVDCHTPLLIVRSDEKI